MRYLLARKLSVFVPSFLLIVLLSLSACSGNTTASKSFVPPKNSHYQIYAPNVDVQIAQNASIQIKIQNTGDEMRNAIARPVYGDFEAFPPTFKLPDMQANQPSDKATTITLQIQPEILTGKTWHIILVVLAPMQDPITKKEIYVMPINGSIEVSYRETSGSVSTAGYIANDHPTKDPDTSPYCVGIVQDNNYFDNVRVTAGQVVDKRWSVKPCTQGQIPQTMIGNPLYASFSFDGKWFSVDKLDDFGRKIIAPDQKGVILVVFILGRSFSVNRTNYFEPLGKSFWFYGVEL